MIYSSRIEVCRRLAGFGLTASPATLAVATLAAMLGAVPAAAQVASAPAMDSASAEPPSATQGDTGLGEIVVTARRVTEKLQDVPASIGVLAEADLTSRQIDSISDLKGAVAGLSTNRTPSAAGNNIAIRGISGVTIPSPATDNSIGFYIDGVYIARTQGAGADIADLARVEVLRGPQGTLFGRNASAGALSFVTNTPSDEFYLNAEALYGNYDRKRGRITLNLPLAEGFAGRVSYTHDETDGDQRNTTRFPQGYDYAGFGHFDPARTYGASNSDALTARLRYTGIEGLTVDYKYDRTDLTETPRGAQIIGFVPGSIAGTIAGILPFQVPGDVTPSFRRLDAYSSAYQSTSKIRTSGHLVNVEYELSDRLTVRSISAWRRVRTLALNDLDGGDYLIPVSATTTLDFCVSCSVNQFQQSQFSQEIQLLGHFDRLSFIGGLYYFTERARLNNTYAIGGILTRSPGVVTPLDTNCALVPAGGPLGDYCIGANSAARNRSYAAYGHVDYRFTDQLELAVGGRFTKDKRMSQDLRASALIPQDQVSYQRFNYDAALTYRFDQNVNVYARYATGYQSGGIERSTSFKPEDTRSAEIGLKGEFLDRKLRMNLAFYFAWIKDRQSAAVFFGPDARIPNNAFPVGLLTYNQEGTSKVKGLEIETTLVPMRGLTLTGNFGYNDPKPSNNTRNISPKITFSFSGQYDAPKFDSGMYLSFRVDGDYRGKYFQAFPVPNQLQTGPFSGAFPAALRQGFASNDAYYAALEKASTSGDYWLANARLSLLDVPLGSTKARIAGYVRNLFDSKGLQYASNYGAIIAGTYEQPRTYGLEVGITF